ncbi:MAG: hypothetical protein C3F11_15710 [Methylocystaceae bacterium]|nr:MAG: hypothetical protein C3F11_15710 [Methylocystaceae bacterium]
MAAETANGDILLGPVRVRVDEERAARLRRETGFAETPETVVPAVYPAVWLTTSEIGGAIRGALAGEDAVPVHESQSFHYFAPLRVGESYDLTVAIRREQAPPRLVVNASVSTQGGDVRLHAEALLRIVPRPVGPGGAP